MPKTGSLAANLHEGARSEYLAQYALSALGMAALIPRQEDVGIDLQCALGKRVGQLLVVEHYYLAQVKSIVDHWTYNGTDSVRWLCAHRHPIFFVHVQKKKNHIDVYQTTQIVHLLAQEQIEEVILVPKAPPLSLVNLQAATKVEIGLGPPILSFGLTEVAQPHWQQHTRDVLRSWIEVDQDNIDHKRQGLNIFAFPQAYQTNNAVKAAMLTGNFKQSLAPHASSIDDELFRHIAGLALRTAAEGDRAKLGALFDFTRNCLVPERTSRHENIWLVQLAIALNTGAKRLGLADRLQLQRANGILWVPEADIVG
jgi:hypothetical protein